jgi:predicted kinase
MPLDSLPRLLIMSGLPGSGKSTEARVWLDEDPGGRRRLNYDDLRRELKVDHSRGFKAKDEQRMKDEAVRRVVEWLEAGLSVVIDNTNLTEGARRRWADVALQRGLSVDYWHLDTPIKVCVQRDRQRPTGERVGQAVIHRMALLNGFVDFDVHLRYIVCDIDGTIANLQHRLHHVKDGQHRWDLFHEQVDQDLPYEDIIKLVQALYASGYKVILVSGRSIGHGCGLKTEDWLLEHHVPYDWLFMRADGDHRPDHQIKEEILQHLPIGSIRYVLDDRDQVVAMWRKHGLRCLQVAPGGF